MRTFWKILNGRLLSLCYNGAETAVLATTVTAGRGRGEAHRGRGGRGPPSAWEGGGRTPRGGGGGGRFRGGGPGARVHACNCPQTGALELCDIACAAVCHVSSPSCFCICTASKASIGHHFKEVV